MSNINQLNVVDTPSGSDLMRIYSQTNGNDRALSLYNLLAWLETQDVAVEDNKVTQYAAPLTGATLAVTDSGDSVWLILTPAGTIATLTLTFPAVANVADKAEILMNTTNTITTLTLAANGASIVGGIVTLAANDFARYRFDSVMQTWYRVG